ncbi:16S rRNA methyltransferase [Steroidobacter denitrificans]|uniref:Ribosomal RNA small subunit methyltransferase H n=1 Tax=Steroidobacter denitrificans TaxID=465721 RepID=A0A127F5W5_STEDE|nr:16S rRNA methyltransferase [Steroidobacter denitrificans]
MLQHTPVLFDEVLAALDIRPGGCYLDATFGRGGHSAGILQRVGREGRLIAIDRDPEAIRAGRDRFAADQRLTLVHSPFSRLAAVVAEMGLAGRFDGVLLDLGVSSPQIDDAERGFSFAQDGPLDMRMDNRVGASAQDFLARAPEHEIARVIRTYGEERFAKRIARRIVAARREAPITRTAQLADIVAAAVPAREPGKHPATRTFQALRIHVNDELEEIRAALEGSLTALAPGGRLCVISFHSLEDGIVKRYMQAHSQEAPLYAGLPEVPAHARPKLRRLGRAVHPSEAEIARNPRARSAIMRVAQRVAA